MPNKAPRKPKVRRRTKMERYRQAFRVLHRKFGIAQLFQWYDEDCKSPPQRGRPRAVTRGWFAPLSEPVRANSPLHAEWRVRFNVPTF